MRVIIGLAVFLFMSGGWSSVYAESTRDDYHSLFRASFQEKQRGNYNGKRLVDYESGEKPGTLVVDTRNRYLYYVLSEGKAWRYGIGVGRAGFEWSGIARIGHMAVWPDWRPPQQMIARELAQYNRRLPALMKGGILNPLGARALYLFKGNRDTMYRIHGTNAPETIGYAVSSGCIRMLNEEVIDLYGRVRPGSKVIVM